MLRGALEGMGACDSSMRRSHMHRCSERVRMCVCVCVRICLCLLLLVARCRRPLGAGRRPLAAAAAAEVRQVDGQAHLNPPTITHSSQAVRW